MSSDKNGPGMIWMLLAGLLVAGCQAGSPGDDSVSRNSSTDSEDVRELDLGQDWDDSWIQELDAARSRGLPGASAPGRRSSYWGIVLGTYASENHARAAANMAKSFAVIDPRLAAAHVHTSDKGSTVVYGVYESSADPAAQRDLKWIKSVTYRDRPVFSRAMLSRIAVGTSGDQRDPASLGSVRRRYPHIKPLYSLQVAIWGRFDGDLTMDEIKRHGETYARELRGRQFEAFYHHDEDLQLSMVTVGLFGADAIDPQSGLYSPDVEALLRVFPVHLVNGEPLNEPIDARRPSLGTRVQKPKLVLVPE